jgi:hypothetical protein
MLPSRDVERTPAARCGGGDLGGVQALQSQWPAVGEQLIVAVWPEPDHGRGSSPQRNIERERLS